jgi:hypothetical protein
MPFDPNKYLESKEVEFSPDDYLKKKGKLDSGVGSPDGESTTPDQGLQSQTNGFRTVQEKGRPILSPMAIQENEPVHTIDFEKENDQIEARQIEQRKLSQLNVKDKYEAIKPQIEEFKSIISRQKSEVDAEFNYTRQTLDELKRAGQLDITAPDVLELTQNFDRLYKENLEKDNQVNNIDNAELFVKDLENIINGKNKKFSEGVYQHTVKKLAFDGIAEIKRNYNLKGISDKISKGEDITADEQLAIASYGLLNEAQSNFQSGIGYDVGSGLVEMVPYLLSFALSGGVSKGVQVGVMDALKATGEKTTKELVKKGIAYTTGQLVRPAFFSSLYSSGIEKQIGQVETTKDLSSSIAEGTKESPQKAFTKAYANTLSEVLTEQLGEVAVPIFNKIIGKEVKQALNPTLIDKIKDVTAFNGFLPEMGEEFANQVATTAIEGRPAEEIFDPRTILTTALTVGVMSGGFAISNKAYKLAINQKEQESGFKFDTKTKKQVDDIVESDKTPEEKAKDLSYIVDSKIKSRAKDEEISNIIQYITSHTAKTTLDEVEPEIEKASQNKEAGTIKVKSEPKASPKEKVSVIEDKPSEITLTEKSPITKDDKAILQLEGDNLFTRQINKDGEKFGQITVEESGDTWKVKDVVVDKEREGYGKEVYRQMNEQAQAEGKTIVSEIPSKNQSQKATYMWESLVKSGEAVKNEDGSYKMLPKEQIIEPKITEEPINASEIRKDQGQVDQGGSTGTEGKGISSPNLQQPEATGAKTGNEETGLTSKEEVPIQESPVTKKPDKNASIKEEKLLKEQKQKMLSDIQSIEDILLGDSKVEAVEMERKLAEENGWKQDKIDSAIEDMYVNKYEGMTPEMKKQLEQLGVKVEDGKFIVDIYKDGSATFSSVRMALRAVEKGFPTNIPKKGTGSGNPPIPTMRKPSQSKLRLKAEIYGSIEEAQKKLDLAKQNYEEAKSKGTEGMKRVWKEALDEEQQIFDIASRLDYSQINKDQKIKEAGGQTEIDKSKQDQVKELLDKEKKDETKVAGAFFFGDIADLFRGKRQKRVSTPFVRFIKEQFSRTKGMPESVFNEWIRTMGAIKARRFDAINSVKEVMAEAEKVFGKKFEPADYEEIQKAFESMGTSQTSKDIAFNIIANKLPKEAKGFIEKMRTMIDGYTNELKTLDLIGINLEAKLDKNQGYYVTRTYKKHTDRNWTWENIPDKIKEDAAKVFMELNPKATADEVLGMMKSMIESKDLTEVLIKQGQSLADIDKSQLNKRSEFLTDHPEIRELLGENRDPFYNYAVSLTKMAEIIERGKMIQNIRDIGLKEGWLSEKQSLDKNHISQIKYNDGIFAGKPGATKLSEYYTTPEIAKAISHFFDYSKVTNPWMRAYMSAITNVKIAKTALSIKGTIRNFKSNFTNWIANGNWNLINTSTELKTRMKDKTSRNEFIRELYEKNIIGDNSNAGELMRNVQDLSDKLTTIMSSDESVTEKTYRKVRGTALEIYSLADDVWKAARYVSEYTRYRDVYLKKGYSESKANEDAKARAMTIMHRTSTYYSQLPKIIQNMRKLPFTNTFVSFPYLTTVNYLGTWQTAIEEMRDPGTAIIGTQRMVGSLIGVSALALLAGYRNREKGQDEEKIESWRRFLPDYWKNDIITIKKDNKNGTAEYGNTSYLDYYNALTTPVLILQRRLTVNGTLTSDDIKDAAGEFAGKFIGWDILFNRITNLKNNKDDNGKQIFNDTEDFRKQFEDMTVYLLETIEPGTITDARRIFQSYREGYNWQNQAVGVFTGSQVRTIDPVKSMSYNILPKYKEIYTDELRKYNRLIQKSESDKDNLDKAKKNSEEILNKIIVEVIKDYDAALKVGCKDEDVKDAIKRTRFDADIRDAIYNRGKVNLDVDGGIVGDVKEQSNVSRIIPQ